MIDYLGFVGSPVTATNMSDFKRVKNNDPYISQMFNPYAAGNVYYAFSSKFQTE